MSAAIPPAGSASTGFAERRPTAALPAGTQPTSRREGAMHRLISLTRGLLIAALYVVAAASSVAVAQAPQATGVTVFEGARLITGDGNAPIEDSAFVVENNRFTAVGRRGEVTIPVGAARVNLAGKTVMPA